MHNYCVILAGGGSSKFWPATREDKPKQFQPVSAGGPSFLQQTYSRALQVFPEDHIFIVSLARFRGLLFEQFPDIAEDHLLLEPYGRGTATSIAFATYTLMARDPEAVMTITPSDHLINNDDGLAETLRAASIHAAENGTLLALGVIPKDPNTNFGYVQIEGAAGSLKGGVPVKAKTFTEKPTEELAKVFVESGEFLWNSGIFVWKASAIREEMHHCCPEITNLWKGWEKALGTIHENRFVEKVYSESPNTSIDYAVLEKSRNLWVMPTDFEWQDVDSFVAYYDDAPGKDADGNLAIFVNGKLFLKEAEGNIIHTENPRKLTVIRGLKDFLVVDTDDVLMITPRDEQALQDTLREMNRPEFADYK